MSTTLVVCPECSNPVAPGRLTCQSCGTLLASVVGADRRLALAVAASTLPEIDEDRPLAAFRPPEPAEQPVRAAEPAAPKRGPRRLTRSKPAAEPARDRYVPAAEPSGGIPQQTSIFGSAPTGTPPTLDDASNSSIVGSTPFGRAGSNLEGGNVPGAYLAPSASYVAPLAPRPMAIPGPTSAPPLAPAPFSPAAASWTVPKASAPATTGHGTIAAPRVSAAPTDDTGRSLSDWLVIGGATLAIVSFVLPWATDGVLGSNGIGYTAQWGLANGGHLILIVAAAFVLLLHLGSSPVPGWFRSSVVPLAVGGLLAGLAFAYYARPFGGGAGVAVLLAGAVLQLVGGVLASRPKRNATGAPTV